MNASRAFSNLIRIVASDMDCLRRESHMTTTGRARVGTELSSKARLTQNSFIVNLALTQTRLN